MALLTTVLAVHADESERLFKVFDSADGLADNGAQVILCTKTGRMVINSIGHINFYNGSSFEHIDPLQQDIYELPNYTGYNHLYFDKKHHLWVKDKKQVTCVNLMTEQFVHDVRGELQAMGFTGKADDLSAAVKKASGASSTFWAAAASGSTASLWTTTGVCWSCRVISCTI